jgi:hypothetical protein
MAGHFCAENIIGLAASLEQSALKASAPALADDAPDADFQLMTNDLTRAMVNLVDSLQLGNRSLRCSTSATAPASLRAPTFGALPPASLQSSYIPVVDRKEQSNEY